MDAEFSRLSCVYSPEVTVGTVKGALRPLLCPRPIQVVCKGSSPINHQVWCPRQPTPQLALLAPRWNHLLILAHQQPSCPLNYSRRSEPSRNPTRSTIQKPNITLRDYSRRRIPIFAKVDLEFHYQDKHIITAVYLRSDQGTASEPCLLGTNVVIPLGLMVPGPGVATKELGLTQVGTVWMMRAERIPGVVMDAQIEGIQGTAIVEPLQSVLEEAGLTLEHMLVEPDSAGKVSIVVTNPSYSEVKLDTGQCVGRVHPCVECAGEAVVADEVALVCHVVADDADLEAVSKRMEKLSKV